MFPYLRYAKSWAIACHSVSAEIGFNKQQPEWVTSWLTLLITSVRSDWIFPSFRLHTRSYAKVHQNSKRLLISAGEWLVGVSTRMRVYDKRQPIKLSRCLSAIHDSLSPPIHPACIQSLANRLNAGNISWLFSKSYSNFMIQRMI